MKKHIKIALVLLLFIVTSCGISEDCFKGNGNRVSQNFPLEDFTKVKVYDGVGLVIKEGPNYEVRVETSDNIIDDLDVKLVDDMLIIKDNSSCNIARDYGQTILYITAPNLTEIHSKTEQEIRSDGVLGFPELKFVSIDLSDGAGTGDFHILINNNYINIETNNISNFYFSGSTDLIEIFVSWGNGRIDAANLVANKIAVSHRGSNDMLLYPIEEISGTIYSTGNIFLHNTPTIINVNHLYSGTIFY